MTFYSSYRGAGTGRPLSLEEKGSLIALGTLLAPHAVLALGGAVRGLTLTRYGLKAAIPFFLSPGGGGPGVSPTSTEISLDWTDPRLRGYGLGHGY